MSAILNVNIVDHSSLVNSTHGRDVHVMCARRQACKCACMQAYVRPQARMHRYISLITLFYAKL